MTLASFLLPAVDSGSLVKETGKVTYTVLIVVGDKVVPVGSKLSVTTSISATMTDNKCNAGNAGDITLGADTPELPTNLVLACTFDVTVTSIHKLAGQIDPILVTAVFTNTGNDDAFYIPPVSSPAVPVYTEGSLTAPTTDASSASSTYYTGAVTDHGPKYQPSYA